MSEPLEIVAKFIRVIDAAGDPVLGLDIDDFTVAAMQVADGETITTWAHGSVMLDAEDILGAGFEGYYGWLYAQPAAGDTHMGIDLVLLDTALSYRFVAVGGELEPKDLLSIYNTANQPQVTISNQGTIGQVRPWTVVAHRKNVIRFSFTNADGSNINMTDGVLYENLTLGIRALDDQTADPPKMDLTGADVVGGNGYVEVTLREDSDCYDAMPEEEQPEDTYTARYELTGDEVADPNETVALVSSSPFIMSRREVGTGAP